MAQAAIPIIAAVISAGGTVYAANQAKKSPKTEKEMRQALYAAIFEKAAAWARHRRQRTR